MTDEIPGAVAPAIDAASPAAIPPSPSVTPSLAPAAQPSEPAAPVVPAVESPVVEPAPEPASTEPAKVEGTVPEGPKTEGAEPEKTQAEAEPAKPAYTEFKLPDGFKAEPAQISAYENVLGKYGISQEAGQELIDFHANQIKALRDQVTQEQQDVFSETRRSWVKQFDKEAGNRRDTMLNDAKWAISKFAGTKAQIAELWNVYAFTGAGDHPAEIRAWANVARAMREREAPAPSLPRNGSGSGAAWDKRYGSQKS